VKPTDITIKNVVLYFIPIEARMPLKFGASVMTQVSCARACITVEGRTGSSASGWGETPLAVEWSWPSTQPYAERNDAMQAFCIQLAEAWQLFEGSGHPIEMGIDFQEDRLKMLHEAFNINRSESETLPWLAALVCCSLFDVAMHDAFGVLHNLPVYETYNEQFMSRDLAQFLTPAEDASVSFAGKYPEEYLASSPPQTIPVWHLVGGKDPLDESELTGSEPDDGYPVLLADWIETDGLNCLKVKLRGDDTAWDYGRLVKVGNLAIKHGVDWLTTDFNCQVTNPTYVNDILDRLVWEHPRIYGMILYVEQPFPHDLEANQIDTHSVSARKPLFLDESSHDWRLVKLGRRLGWTGVALKTCKTQSGALLSLCFAKAHGMTLMVQDLTNPMLAMIPHTLLAAHAGTIMGVESNAMQFYPEASITEATVHPGLYQRRDGVLDFSTLRGPGFGYRIEEIGRSLPTPAYGEPA